MKISLQQSSSKTPGLLSSAAPIVLLLSLLIGIIVFAGADAISAFSPFGLLLASAIAVILSYCGGSLSKRGMTLGLRRSARQILPAVPMLVCIAMVATTWMLSGVVPVLIEYGLRILNPTFFLVITCGVCGAISVLTGSSWSTIATIGVAFMGIGSVMGFHPGWVAGAIISGAYFGDKVSPLSDTTVISASACGVDLFTHIRYLLITTVPSLLIAMIVFFFAGLGIDGSATVGGADIVPQLAANFNLSPWVLVIPLITLTLIVLRVPTIITLFASSMLGLAGIFVFQPGICSMLGADSFGGALAAIPGLLWSDTTFATGNELFDNLVSTSGIMGMLPTVFLVLSAMIFGTCMIGTGMLATLTNALTKRLSKRFELVGSTVAGGLFLNSCTADQYLSIIIGGNMFRNAYRRCGLEPRLLSRTLEDSVSVTSVLIPWNSCGVTQSAVLGVSTLVFAPYCIFNYLSPLMTLIISLTGFKIKQTVRRHAASRVEMA